MWRHGTESTLDQVMVCCLTATMLIFFLQAMPWIPGCEESVFIQLLFTAEYDLAPICTCKKTHGVTRWTWYHNTSTSCLCDVSGGHITMLVRKGHPWDRQLTGQQRNVFTIRHSDYSPPATINSASTNNKVVIILFVHRGFSVNFFFIQGPYHDHLIFIMGIPIPDRP